MNGVMLCRAVIPDSDSVRLPAQTHLIFGDLSLTNEVVQQVVRFDGEVLSVSNIFVVVKVHEVRREALIDEQSFFASIRVRADDWMFDRRIGLAQFSAVFGRHAAAE